MVSELRDEWGPLVDTLDAGTNEDAAKADDLVVIATILSLIHI